MVDDLTRKRYDELRDAGAKVVLISCAPYHPASVPPRSLQRAQRIALEVFGHGNVIAGASSLAELERMVEIGRSKTLLREYTKEHPPRLVGRTGRELARFLPDRPIKDLRSNELWHDGTSCDESCRSEFDPQEMWEIHIDPYGNIQTCCGIVIGNAHQTPLPDLMKTEFTCNDLVRIVDEEGPFGLLRLAVKLGYDPKDGYPQKCKPVLGGQEIPPTILPRDPRTRRDLYQARPTVTTPLAVPR